MAMRLSSARVAAVSLSLVVSQLANAVAWGALKFEVALPYSTRAELAAFQGLWGAESDGHGISAAMVSSRCSCLIQSESSGLAAPKISAESFCCSALLVT